MANISGASLNGIYTRLHEAPQYHPLEAETFADWSVEAGDMVTVKRGQETYQSPIHKSKLVWTGAPVLSINATGKKERNPVSKVSKQKYRRSAAGMQNEHGLYSYVYASESTLYSYVDQTATYIVSHVEDVENDLGSEILQTASAIRSEVHAADSMLYTYVDQTATYILSHVEDVENDLGSEILQTASQIRSEVHAANSQLYSYVDQTATYIVSHVENEISDLGSEILQTASQIRSEVHAADSQLYSYVDQTATYIVSHVENEISDLGSEILQTASQIRSEVHAADSQLYSYVDQTATYIVSHVENEISDLGSEILQTASQIRSEVHAANSQLYSYVDQTATYISSHVDDVESDLHSEIMQTQSMIHSAVWTANSELVSYIDQTATYILSHVDDVENDLGSDILQTASQIRSEVHAANSQLYSYIDQTATYISSHVDDVECDLHSEIMQTQSMIHSSVWTANSELVTYIDQTATYILSHVDDVANDLGSEILQTASQIRSEVHAADSQLYSYVDQTATYISSHVEDVANDLGSEILQTASQIRSEVHAADSQLYSYVDQTATYISSHVEDVANDLGSEILQTASQIRSEVHAADSQLYSYVDQTSTYILSHVEDVENDLGSEILQTASQIRSEVHAANSQLYSYVDQTATYISSHVENEISSLGSEILQTASQIRSEVHAADSALYSYVDITATQIEQSVASTESSLRSSIKTQADRISLVVEGTGNSAHIKAAEIAASINEEGSQALISADRVMIDGNNTTISDVISVQNNGSGNNKGIHVNGKSVFSSSLYVLNHNLEAGNLVDLQNAIVSATVVDNVLTLTNAQGEQVTFSKAASINSLTGAWSGSGNNQILTVSTNPSTGKTYTVGFGTSDDTNLHLLSNGTPTINESDSKYLDVPLKIVSWVTGTPPTETTRYSETFTVNATPVWEDGNALGYASAHVSGSWNNNVFTYTKTTSGSSNSGSETFGSKFDYNQSGYAIVATHEIDSQHNQGAISNTYKYYQLGVNSSGTKVQIQQTNGTKYDSTPEYTLPTVSSALIDEWYSGKTWIVNVTMSNGATGSTSLDCTTPYNTGYNAVRLLPTWDANQPNKLTVSKTSNTSYGTDYSMYVFASYDDGEDNVNTLKYNSTTHKYSGYARAKAGTSASDAVIRSSSGIETGTEAYSDGYSSAHVSGSWSNNVFTYTKTTSGSSNSGSETFGSKFDYNQSGYAIVATHEIDSQHNQGAISNTYNYYQLGVNSSGTKVQIQQTNGTKYDSTPEYTLPTVSSASIGDWYQNREWIVNVTMSNGATGSTSLDCTTPYNTGYNAVRLLPTWDANQPNKLTVSKTSNTSYGTDYSMYVVASYDDGEDNVNTLKYNSTTHKYSGYARAKAGTTASNAVTKSSAGIETGTEAYSDGYSSAHVSGSWSNNVFTYTKTTSGSSNSGSETFGSKFDYNQSGYAIVATHEIDSQHRQGTISNTYNFYQLGVNSSGTKVQIQQTNGTKYNNTPEYTLTYQNPYGTPIAEYGEKREDNITANGRSTAFKLQAGTARVVPASPNSCGCINLYFKDSNGDSCTIGRYIDSDCIASNIRNNIEIFGVTGSYTSDATATAAMIRSGYTAYASGSKITGTMPDMTIDYNSSLPTGTGSAGTIPYGKYIKVPNGYHSATTYYATQTDLNLSAGNIKNGVTILGVTGSYTSDATATAAMIRSGYTAYASGSKITGTMPDMTIDYNSSLPTGTGSAGTIPYGKYIKVPDGYHSATTYYATQTDSNLSAGNIKKNVTILGVTGTYQASVSKDDIQIGPYNNVSTEPEADVVATAMREVLLAAINNKNWFRFKVTVNGTEKYYKMSFK